MPRQVEKMTKIESTTDESRSNRAPAAVRLEFEKIQHCFIQGDSVVDALDGVTFAVAPGEFVAIVGPSGCGKTTLLGMAAGMIKPTAGTVKFDHSVLSKTSSEVAYMLARDALLPWRTAAENVELALQVRGIERTERQERALEWLELLGLAESRNVNVTRLSHGMRQRVAIARTLAQSPRCVLMDEPFAALDAQTRVKVQEAFLELWERQRPTVVFVTHDLAEALLMADRVIVMSRGPGRIVRDLPVPIRRPRDPEIDRGSSEFISLYDELWQELKAQFDNI